MYFTAVGGMIPPSEPPISRNELQKALKEAGVKNPNYWSFNSSLLLYFINENNFVDADVICEHSECIAFEDLFVENYEGCQFESELMTLLGG